MRSQDYVREVYDASYRRLVIQLFAVCGDRAEAEDAVQEAFVKALARASTFEAVGNPEAWLRTVAVNHVRSRWRHTQVARRFQGRVQAPVVPLELGPDHVALVDALSHLDVAHRTTVVLHYLADLSVAAVAEELGVPEGTVKSRLSTSRGVLGPLLSDHEGEDAEHV